MMTVMVMMHDARMHDDHMTRMMLANDHFIRLRHAGHAHETGETNRRRYHQFFHHDWIISASL